MLEVLSKPLDVIDVTDIQLLVDLDTPEGEQIEFKKELPGERGTPDPWALGGNKIGNHAKDTILKEIVAFANAYGGVLLLGIEESAEKPAVASKISPIPRCNDLAERLRLVFRDRVEPHLTRLDVVGVPVAGDSGVVVIRVGRSRLAPHRVTRTRICAVRRADRCEEMTMREIQDGTLNMSRGLERVGKRLEERAIAFGREFERLETPGDSFGIRFTAVPVGDDLRIERVFRNYEFISEYEKPRISIIRTSESGCEIRLSGPEGVHSLSPTGWRPGLRFGRAETGHGKSHVPPWARSVYQEVHCDGTIEYGFVSARVIQREERCYPLDFHPDMPIVMLGTVAVWADRLRRQVGTPAAEYCVEGEIHVLGGEVKVDSDRLDPFSPSGTLQPGRVKFQRYSLDDADEVPNLLISFYRDFWNAMCRHVPDEKSDFIIEVR